MQKTDEKMKVGFVSLGCDKNRVDTERVVSILSCYDEFEFSPNAEECDIIFINTCAFLKASRDEAEGIIEEMSGYKKRGSLKLLVVMGCLPMLNTEDMIERFPMVDKAMLADEYDKVDKIVFELLGKKLPKGRRDSDFRSKTTTGHFAYLKIADGCSNRCAFCKIPYIRGNYKSVKMEKIVSEAEYLCENGAKEVILVAQDVTRFGCEKNGKENLPLLLKKLSKIKKLSWIRLLYCYPEKITDELIEVIKTNPKVLHYVDMPLQHISNNVLRAMNRQSTRESIVGLITKLRHEIPDIAIRSTFMVGFPGETEEDVKELVKFLKKAKLDNVGFFKYSREEGTPAYSMEHQISEKEKDRRLEIVQKTQQAVATKVNKSRVGKTYKVLIDRFDEKLGCYVGRGYFSAPDVDFEIYFSSFKRHKIGSFADVKIIKYVDEIFVGEVERTTTY